MSISDSNRPYILVISMLSTPSNFIDWRKRSLQVLCFIVGYQCEKSFQLCVHAWRMCMHGKHACIENVHAWKTCMHGERACMENRHAWKMCMHGKRSCMENVQAWRTCRHGERACMENVHAWRTCMHGEQACMENVYAWKSSCMKNMHAWKTCMHGKRACTENSLIIIIIIILWCPQWSDNARHWHRAHSSTTSTKIPDDWMQTLRLSIAMLLDAVLDGFLNAVEPVVQAQVDFGFFAGKIWLYECVGSYLVIMLYTSASWNIQQL